MKLAKKNKGNRLLVAAVSELLKDLEAGTWKDNVELKKDRPDADKVHSDGAFFFDIHIHRSLVMVYFDDKEVEIAWAGTHQEYEDTFKNNKSVIKKWLKDKGYID